jgi:hypothetical protein
MNASQAPAENRWLFAVESLRIWNRIAREIRSPVRRAGRHASLHQFYGGKELQAGLDKYK